MHDPPCIVAEAYLVLHSYACFAWSWLLYLYADSCLCAAAYAFLLMFTAPFVFGIAAVHTAAGYIISRFLIGWALAGFVTCQFWTSIMFSPNVVGFANALAGGWGNAGQAPSCNPDLTTCTVRCTLHNLTAAHQHQFCSETPRFVCCACCHGLML